METDKLKLWDDYKTKLDELLKYTSNLPTELQSKARNDLKEKLELPAQHADGRPFGDKIKNGNSHPLKRRGRPTGSRKICSRNEESPHGITTVTTPHKSSATETKTTVPLMQPSTHSTRPVRSTPSRYRVHRDIADKPEANVTPKNKVVKMESLEEEETALSVNSRDYQVDENNEENLPSTKSYKVISESLRSVVTSDDDDALDMREYSVEKKVLESSIDISCTYSHPFSEVKSVTEYETKDDVILKQLKNSEDKIEDSLERDSNLVTPKTGINTSLPKIPAPEFTRSWKCRRKTPSKRIDHSQDAIDGTDDSQITTEYDIVSDDLINQTDHMEDGDDQIPHEVNDGEDQHKTSVVDVSDLVNSVTLNGEDPSVDLSSAELVPVQQWTNDGRLPEELEEVYKNYPLAEQAKLEEQAKPKDQVVIVISKKPVDNLLEGEGDPSNQTLPNDVAETLTAAVTKDPKNAGAEKIIYLVDASSYKTSFDKPVQPRKRSRKAAVKAENDCEADEGESEEDVPLRKRRPRKNLYFSDEKIHSACHMCPECNQIWPTRDSLREHLKKKHRGDYKCDICGRKFAYKHIYDNHKTLHENGDFHKCPHCANMIQGKDRLDEHVKQRHEKRVGINKVYLQCNLCEQSFRSQKLRHEHMKKVHSDAKVAINCLICNRRFFYVAAFNEHEKQHEMGLLFKCPREGCSYHYKTDQELETHTSRTHERNAARPHLCHVCCKAFTEARYLKIHMASHKRGKKFVCDSCMFETFSIQQLKLHLINKHSMTLAHVCNICGAKLTTKGGLQDHLRRHYNQRDFNCPICDKSFVSKSQVAAHRKIHEPRRFACGECNRLFVTKHKLAEHAVTHTDDREFECLHEHCSYRTSQKSNLYKHMERIHKMKHPEKYINYRYVEKIQIANESDVNEVTVKAEATDWINKSDHYIDNGNLINIPQTMEEQHVVLQDDGKSVLNMIESREAAFTDQAEAAEVLAQMQSAPVLVRTPNGQPQYHVITYLPDQYTIQEDLMKPKSEITDSLVHNALEEQAIQVENVENVIHLPENSDEVPVSYMLHVDGDQEQMISLSAEDLGIGTVDAEGKYVAVESGTVLIDNAGNILKVVE